MSSKLDKNKIFSSMATEHTLREVVTAVKATSINIGDIAFGNVNVQSDDITTHGKLDVTNTAIGLSNSKLEDVKTKLDTINTSINDKTLDKLTSSIDISGQYLNVPLISGFTLNTTTLSTNDTLNRILNKEGDIQGKIYYTEGASVWADSAPVPTVNVLNPKGWLYTNTNAGNAMNLFYFNGTNETRILSEISGMYAVVENLSTKLNDSMIFGIYTKSATSFFTSRITHSPASGVDMVAGGKYLLFWGDVDEYIYPNLPRLAFTSVGTTGPANPSEEILSVTLNTNSSTPAGDIKISIETLGVVFDLEAREYNLLGSPTEYQTLVNINTNVGNSNTSLSAIKSNSDKLKYVNEDLKAVISNTGFNCDNIANTPLITGFATQSTLADIKSNSDKLKYVNEDLKAVISNTGFNCDNIANTPLITGFATQSTLADIKSNSDKLKYVNEDLKAVISNTGFDCNNIANTPLITGFATQTTLADIKANTDKNKYASEDLKTVVSNSGFNCNNIANTPLITGFATQSTLADIKSNSDKLKYVNEDLKAVLSNTGFNCDNIANTPLITGFATQTTLADIKANTDKNKYASEDLKTVVSNSGFNCNNIANTPLITGFSTSELQTAGNTSLNNIKLNSDKLTYDPSGNLCVNVKIGGGGGSVDGTVNIKDSNGANILATTGSLNSNITNTSLAVTGTFFQATQPVSVNALPDVTITNTSFDSRLRDGDNNIINSTQYGIDPEFTHALDVCIKNATQAEPLIVEIPVTNVLTCAVNNFPVEYPINAGGALNSAVGALYVNLRDTNGNPYGIADAPLKVDSNLITGFALEDGNLATIKTNSDKFKFEGNNLKCEVVNAGTNNLGVTVSNQITGFATESGNLASIKANSDKLIYDPSGNLCVNVKIGGGSGSSINIKDTDGKNIFSDASGNLNTVCSGRNASGVSKELLVTNGGNLIVEAKAHDGGNNPITSTLIGAKRSLDVNVANQVTLTPQPTYGITLQDPEPGVYQPLTMYQTTYAGNLLKVFSCNVMGNPTYLEQETQLGSIITNTGDTNTSIGTTNTKLETILTNSNKLIYDPSGNLKVNVVVGGGGGGSSDIQFGTYNNIVNNSDLAASSFSNALFINNLCGNETVISYEDTAVTQTSFISIYGGFDDTNYFYIGVLQPALIRANKRNASAVLKLKGLKYIKIYNENTSVAVTAVKATLFSG